MTIETTRFSTIKIVEKTKAVTLDIAANTNNLAENSIDPLALSRKNYLLCENDSAAYNAAIIYSLMRCYIASEVNFREWFAYFMKNIY